MYQFAGTPLGFGTPFATPVSQLSLQAPATQAIGGFGGYGIGAMQPSAQALQPSAQIVPLLQAVTHQLQQVQVLEQQEIFYLQQLLQLVPAQLQQLQQQLMQLAPQSLQHAQQPWQQFGQAIPGQFGIGMTPAFAGQSGHVM
jgi:hypothetical protein